MEHLRSPTKTSVRPRSRKSIAHMPSSEIANDKENLTSILPETPALVSPSIAGTKKARSKSIGPGGLDALHIDSGNRQRPVMAVQYKSILKPTIPLSPPKLIPPHNGTRRASYTKSKQKVSPGKPRMGQLVDISEPEDIMLSPQGSGPAGRVVGTARQSVSVSPGRGQTRVAVRTEEEQQAAVIERERQDLIARKDARRRSLANRRVSFAPEATLHTWDVVEMPEDSTTSSASTNSTRRASSMTSQAASPYTQPRSPLPGSEASEPPSTPPQQLEEVQVAASPAHQRDLHQKKRRRSSGIPPMNFNNPNDFSSSPYSAGSINSDDSDRQVTANEIDAQSSDSDDKDLVEDETVTEIDREDATRRSDDSSVAGSSGRLEEALRQAAQQAGTQGIEFDENGDITMDMADDEVTAAFKPWTNRGTNEPEILGNLSSLQDQENINPFSPAFKAKVERPVEEDMEETMEFTKAVGTILPPQQQKDCVTQRDLQKPQIFNQPSVIETRRRLSSSTVDQGDETMDLTMAMGGIQPNHHVRLEDGNTGNIGDSDEDEDLSMDFTAVVGGVLSQKAGLFNRTDRSLEAGAGETPKTKHEDDQEHYSLVEHGQLIDIQSAVGKKTLPSIVEGLEPAEEDTMGMDITTAIGTILTRHRDTGGSDQARRMAAQKTDKNEIVEPVSQYVKEPLSDRLVSTASESGSPSLVHAHVRGGARYGETSRLSLTPKTLSRPSSPAKKPATPCKQVTPEVVRPVTPGKTPPSKNVAMRTGVPKRLFKAETKQAASSPTRGTPVSPPPTSNTDHITGPKPNLKPGSRRTSGFGVDRIGIGSPRVTEILDRRDSISESSAAFLSIGKPSGGVRFADPRVLEHQFEQERLDDEHRESGRGILQSEADDQDLPTEEVVTVNLKDRIQSLSPQKKRLKGRKSLHVGAAKGILGKRPIELDEEDEEGSTPNHMRALESSPVKKIKLPPPPSKAITSGRVTRSARLSLAEASNNVRPSTPLIDASPLKAGPVTTPKDQPRFKDANAAASTVQGAPNLKEGRMAAESSATKRPETDDRIHLQDFLNLTSIHFMELTTTKRRHTIAPNPLLEQAAPGADGVARPDAGTELEKCVVAGACTLPMLDLYQHSCRELKRYIAEGRNIVREIETETFEDNPILFREYISAPADVKSVMHNQFKNVKTHARLLSKAMWYEWRMKLLDGLKEGLLKNGEGMDEDANNLTQREDLIHATLPDLAAEHLRLGKEVDALQVQAEELASCDQEELKVARSDLIAIENDISAKQSQLDRLQSQLRQTENKLESAVERKHECNAEIQQAETVRQECQAWDPSEVQILEESVNALEREHGWTVTSAAEHTLTMTYRRALQLYFSPGAFKSNSSQVEVARWENASISLTYIADGHEYHPQPLSTEKRFFLQIMRAQLQFLQQADVTVKDLLHFISSSWEKACQVAEEARMLGVHYMIEPTIMSDETMAVNCSILLRAIKTKVDVAFEVSIRSGDGVAGLDVTVKPSARVVYGEVLNAKKMGDFLEQKLDAKKGAHGESVPWLQVVGELEQKLIKRGKKS